MRILKQLMIILFISFLGEILKMVIPLPIPASVYGLVIMVAALKTGILKLHQVKDASSVLIETMPVMFIPAAVGLMTAWGALRPICGPVAVMAATGVVTQTMIRRKRRRRK